MDCHGCYTKCRFVDDLMDESPFFHWLKYLNKYPDTVKVILKASMVNK